MKAFATALTVLVGIVLFDGVRAATQAPQAAPLRIIS